MGPKIQAVIEFLEGGGGMGLITNPSNIGRAWPVETGTFMCGKGAHSHSQLIKEDIGSIT